MENDIRIMPSIRFIEKSNGYQIEVNGVDIGDFYPINPFKDEAKAFIHQMENLKMIMRDAVYDQIRGMDELVQKNID